jgi:hypothetical protein
VLKVKALGMEEKEEKWMSGWFNAKLQKNKGAKGIPLHLA